MASREKDMATDSGRSIGMTKSSAPAIVVGALYFVSVTILFASIFVPDGEDHYYSNWIAILGFIGTTASILLAAFTFFRSAANAQKQSRKQHTVTILLESRLSSEFRATNEKRKSVFRPQTDILHEDWDHAQKRLAHGTATTPDEIENRYEASEALTFMLNYYEFLALGIRTGDLDEELLKGTMRGLMCSMVDDARDVIFHLRKDSPKIYEHLSLLYARWRDPKRMNDGKLSERPIECCCPAEDSEAEITTSA